MTYDEALAKSRAASREFMKAQADYRARRIDDATFLAAKARHDAAIAEFDLAFAKAHGEAVSYYVAKMYPEGHELRTGSKDHATVEKAIASAKLIAREVRKSKKNAIASGAKTEFLPTHVVVRKLQEGTAVNFLQHVIEV